MKLSDMIQKPSRAGLAKIVFSNEVERFPVLQDDLITLPDNPDIDFFFLKNGEQFLVNVPAPETPRPFMNFLGNQEDFVPSSYWFGGTDESPFLSQLRKYAFDTYRNPEKNFFSALKPSLLRLLESRYNTLALRQGDIFALSLPYTWNYLLGIGKGIISELKYEFLFRTRHCLTGRCVKNTSLFGIIDISSPSCLGEGTVTAPDHAPLQLDGPHILFQAIGTYAGHLDD